MKPSLSPLALFLSLLALMLPSSAGAWSKGHNVITTAAVQVMPEALRKTWAALHRSALDLLPTFANMASASAEFPATKVAATLDGRDVTAMLKGQSREPRLLFHYFGVQLQAVSEGPWKLFLPISEPPKLRVPSLWFEHQDGLFERQHRLWRKPTLYDFSADVTEKVDVAEKHPEVVARLLRAAKSFDASFQKQIPPVRYLPGPKPPSAGQVRTSAESIEEWLTMAQ